MRNHNAHGITQSEQSEGMWDDDKLRRLSTLALEVIVCLSESYITRIYCILLSYWAGAVQYQPIG